MAKWQRDNDQRKNSGLLSFCSCDGKEFLIIVAGVVLNQASSENYREKNNVSLIMR
jgi:hypothetical protein